MTATLKLRDETRATQLRVSTGRRTRSIWARQGLNLLAPALHPFHLWQGWAMFAPDPPSTELTLVLTGTSTDSTPFKWHLKPPGELSWLRSFYDGRAGKWYEQLVKSFELRGTFRTDLARFAAFGPPQLAGKGDLLKLEITEEWRTPAPPPWLGFETPETVRSVPLGEFNAVRGRMK